LAAKRPAEAIRLGEENLRLAAGAAGLDDRVVLTCRHNLAQAYLAHGETTEAIALLEQTLRLRESRIGVDHPDTLASRGSLAVAYREAGRVDEAIRLGEMTLTLSKTRLGFVHPDTLTSRHHLAMAYRAAGRVDEAIQMHEENLLLRETYLGPVANETYNTRLHLALSYIDAGRTTQAEALFEEMRPGAGTDGPDAIRVTAELAGTRERLGRWAAAEPLRRDVVARLRASHRPQSPALASELDALGRNLIEQSKWSAAEPALRECLAIRSRMIPDDWSRFHAMSFLGTALIGQGKYAEAEPLVVSGYEGLKAREAKIPPVGRPCVTAAAGRVVSLYESWGKPEKAHDWRARLGLARLPADVFARP
jgi:tetratricopeptide (TPR) repeat protein